MGRAALVGGGAGLVLCLGLALLLIFERMAHNETRDLLQRKEQELGTLTAEVKKKSEVDALTPKLFGSYAVLDGRALVKLQQLRNEERQHPADQVMYLDNPVVTLKSPVRLVIYNRLFSMAAPTTMFVHIVAKVKDRDGGWVVRNRGYNVAVAPRPANREIIELSQPLPPGRYAIQMEGYQSFVVEGDNSDPNHCVTMKQSTWNNQFVVCPGGKPD